MNHTAEGASVNVDLKSPPHIHLIHQPPYIKYNQCVNSIQTVITYLYFNKSAIINIQILSNVQ